MPEDGGSEVSKRALQKRVKALMEKTESLREALAQKERELAEASRLFADELSSQASQPSQPPSEPRENTRKTKLVAPRRRTRGNPAELAQESASSSEEDESSPRGKAASDSEWRPTATSSDETSAKKRSRRRSSDGKSDSEWQPPAKNTSSDDEEADSENEKKITTSAKKRSSRRSSDGKSDSEWEPSAKNALSSDDDECSDEEGSDDEGSDEEGSDEEPDSKKEKEMTISAKKRSRRRSSEEDVTRSAKKRSRRGSTESSVPTQETTTPRKGRLREKHASQWSSDEDDELFLTKGPLSPAQSVVAQRKERREKAVPSFAFVARRYRRGSLVEVKWDDEWFIGTVVRIDKKAVVVSFEDEATTSAFTSTVDVDFADIEEDLRIYEEASKKDDEEEENDDHEYEEEPYPREPEHFCKSCGKECKAAYSQRNHRWYWFCAVDGFDAWDKLKGFLSSDGPHCVCGEPSRMVRDPQGQRYWQCRKTANACAFNAAVDDVVVVKKEHEEEAVLFVADGEKEKDVATITKQEEGSTFDEEFVASEQTTRRLTALFRMKSSGYSLGRGKPDGYFDDLEVVRAWRVKHRERRERYEARRESVAAAPSRVDVALEGTKDLVDSGDVEELDASKNEVLLLHGTRAEVVHGILERSLDPGLARGGLFGSGTYFADDASKIEQYVNTEKEAVPALRALYAKLYDFQGDRPDETLFYALVCRVILGEPLVTKNGETTVDTGDRVYLDGSGSGAHRCRKLSRGAHSLLALAGPDCKAPTTREFIVFDKDAIAIEYLVAVKRVKRFCDCGLPLVERTTLKDDDFYTFALLLSRHLQILRALPPLLLQKAPRIGFLLGRGREK